MNDVLAYYYENIYNDCDKPIDQIIMMCLTNPHVLKNSIDMYNELIKKKNEYEQTTQVVNRSKAYLGMLLGGVGLYFHYLQDYDNALRIFRLAVPTNNIVALAFINNKGFETAEFVATQTECDKMIYNIIRNCISIVDTKHIMYDKLLMQKIMVDAAMSVEQSALNAFNEYELKTYNEIKKAVEFASYSVDFDIENFYNFEEISKLL